MLGLANLCHVAAGWLAAVVVPFPYFYDIFSRIFPVLIITSVKDVFHIFLQKVRVVKSTCGSGAVY